MELIVFFICLIIISIGLRFFYIYGYKPVMEQQKTLLRLTKEMGDKYFKYTGGSSGRFSLPTFFGSADSELTLLNQDPRIAEFIELKAYNPNLTSTTPQKLVYTGATVGGITTGGFHTVGGDVIKTSVRTQRVEMKFYKTSIENDKLVWELKPITSIYLGNDDLREKAKHSKIRDYLDQNGCNIIVKEENKVSATAVLLYQAGRQEASANQVTLDSIASYPSIGKCKAIMDFICGVDDKTTNKKDK